MWFVNAAINTANKIDEITGRKASKFLKKKCW
jgi:hypothetical protein